MNLLIVDDTPINLNLLRAQLEAEGHTVFEAHNGVDALALLNRQGVDAVISDILMPRMDGYRLCHEIRKHARLHDLPVIIHTSTFTSPSDEKLALDVGAGKYLTKPASVKTIIAALHEVIAMPHAAPQPKALQEVEVLKEYSEQLVNKLEEKNTELMAAEVKFRALVEQSIVGIYIIQDDQFVYVNPRMTEIFGRSEEEMTSRTIYDFLVPEDHALGRENIRKRISGEVRSIHYYLRIFHQSGAVLEVEIHSNRADYNGRPAVMGTLLDITERKQAEEQLRASEERLRAVIDNEPECVKLVDKDGLILEMNPAGLRMIEADSLAQVQKQSFKSIIVEEHRAAFRALLGKTLRGESGMLEFDIIGLKGTRRTLDTHAVPLRDATGAVTSMLGITRDITERKRAEVARRRSEEQLATLIHSVDGIVWEADAETFRFTFVSPRAERLLGYPTARWTDVPAFWVDHIHPDDRMHASGYCLQCTREKRDHEFEYRMLAADGRTVWLRDIVTVVVENGRAVKLCGIMVDITEGKQAEAELRAAEQRLRGLVGRLHTIREEEAKRIARELHDDLGQQLTALNMELDDLEMKLPGATPNQRNQIARIHTVVDHTIEVVQKIAGELRLGQLDVLGLTAAIDWQLKEFSRRSAIPCRIIRLDEIANLSDAQSTAVFRILQEALTNIVRHAGATVVEVSLQAERDHLTLRVRDNGRGITAAELNAPKAIGLLGIRERVQIVGGDVTITGDAGVGTSVLVRIPLNLTGAIPA